MAPFLKAHDVIEDLAIGRMLPGYQGGDFASLLRSEDGSRVLPCLKRLDCSSLQAVAILPHVNDTLETLSGVEVNETIILNDFFDFDHDWEPDDDDNEDETWYGSIASPWRTAFLDALSTCRSLKTVSVIHHPRFEDMFLLASAVPWIQRFDYPDCTHVANADVEQVCSLAYSDIAELMLKDDPSVVSIVVFAILQVSGANHSGSP